MLLQGRGKGYGFFQRMRYGQQPRRFGRGLNQLRLRPRIFKRIVLLSELSRKMAAIAFLVSVALLMLELEKDFYPTERDLKPGWKAQGLARRDGKRVAGPPT